ncbi:MAG: hypothetical protein JWL70_157 [Acidimicrobiia bacterium]|nr:hypothetical protein [Acidimicrobiia bacterium]
MTRWRDPYGDPTWLQHNRVKLALHQLDEHEAPTGHTLLLLHGLGEASPEVMPDWAQAWAGRVYALDFTGHGRSTVPAGGGYTPEILIADVDAALARLGPCTVVGRGLGGYVAVLIAGSRPTHVRGAVVCDGPGLAGGGPQPALGVIVGMDEANSELTWGQSPDPWALMELTTDPRPPDYAVRFVQDAAKGSMADPVIAVAATERLPWLDAVRNEPSVVELTVEAALARYASA